MGIREFSVLFMACTATAGQAQIRLDVLDQAQRAFHQEHYTEARELYAQACQTVLDQGGPQLTECLLLLGTAANSMGDLGQALSLYTRARALCKDDSATCAWLLYDLAGVYQYLERFPEAEQTARQALLASTVAPGKSHPDKMLSIVRLGRILVDAGKLEEAEPLLRGAVAAVRQGGLPADIVLAQGQLGALLVARRQFAEAAALLRDNLQQVSAQFGADHAKTADAFLKLGALYRLEGDWARAQPLVRRASYLYEKRFGPDCLELAAALREEGHIALGAGETSISQRLFKRALDVLRISLPPDSPDVLALRHSLAQTYLAQGKYQHAETLLSDVLEVERRLYPTSERLAIELATMGKVYSGLKRADRAAAFYEESISMFERRLTFSPHFRAALLDYAALVKRSDRSKARQIELRAKALQTGAKGR